MKTVILGFSGGVDSAVCAVLLRKNGYAVKGVYLDNTDDTARRSAEEAAEFIGIPLTVVDVRQELEEKVCRPFMESYLCGKTPNPCILCNPALKFRTLLSVADESGAEAIATGHYARTEGGKLFRGNRENDQSYMLCRLTREQLKRLILPLGTYPKKEVRAMAAEFSLPVANKPDSMEICFIPDKDYVSWLRNRTVLPPPGPLLLHGREIGQHRGIVCYTVGQRLPGLYDGRKVYISKINAESNSIELAWWEELFRTEILADNFNWLCDIPEEDFFASVRVRHTKWETPNCRVHINSDGSVLIQCEEAVRAPAAGQSAVLYSGEQVLGGGFIL